MQGLLHLGILDGWVGWRTVTSTDSNIEGNSHLTYGGNAFASIPLGERISMQLDAQGEFHADGQELAPKGAAMLGGHLSYRDPSNYLIGAFAGFGRPLASIGNDTPGSHSGWGYVLGGEGQVYVDKLTLYGQAGFGDFKVDDNGGPEGFVNGWFVRGVARYFFNEEFFVEGEYAYGYTNCYIDGSCAPTQDAGVFHNWGAKAVFRLPHATTMPIYGTLAYQGGSYYATNDLDTGTEHSFRVGLRVMFGKAGAPTLLANDRYGATLDTPMLPARAAAWTETLD